MFELFLAKKYLFGGRNRLLRIVSVVAFIGVALGVATLIVVLSVNNGFLAVFEKRILDVYPHLVVMKRFEAFTDYRRTEAALAALPEVTGVSHATYDEMMVSAQGRSRGVLVKGIAPDAPMYQETMAPFLKPPPGQEASQGDQSAGGLGLESLLETASARVERGRVLVGGLVQGGVYRLLVFDDGAGLKPILLQADTTSPGPAACRVQSVILPSGSDGSATKADEQAAPVATNAEGTEVLLHGERAVELDLGEWTVIGGYKASALRCGYGGRLLVVSRAGFEPLVLEQPRVERSLSEAIVIVDHLGLGDLSLAGASAEDGLPEIALPGETRGKVLRAAGQRPRLFMGVTLADELDVKIGETVTLLTPLRGLDNREAAPFGMAPTAQQFDLAGILRTGFHDFDRRLVVTSFPWMTRFQNQGDEPRWVEVRLKDPERLEAGTRAVRTALDPYGLADFLVGSLDLVERTRAITALNTELKPDASLTEYLDASAGALGLIKFEDLSFGYRERFKIIDWEDMNRNLFSSLTLQKVALALFFLIIVVIASFSIVSTQLLLLSNKLTDIAILRSMGALRRSVARVFTLHGLLLAVAGILGGLCLGAGIVVLLQVMPFKLDASVYLISYLPVDPRPAEIAWIVVVALVFAAATVRLGAVYAASKTPIDALRMKK